MDSYDILLIFFTIFLLFFKTAYLGPKIREDIARHHGKRFFRKNKPKGFLKCYFYVGFRNSTNPFFYWGNILLPAFAVINVFVRILCIFFELMWLFKLSLTVSVVLIIVTWGVFLFRSLIDDTMETNSSVIKIIKILILLLVIIFTAHRIFF